MITVYKNQQISDISVNLGISKLSVKAIIDAYVDYLKCKMDGGETVKFLNVFYLRVNKKKESIHETLAYISSEIAKIVEQSQSYVYRVLLCYEDMIVKDLKSGYSYNIRGLASIKLDRNYKGEYIPCIKKSPTNAKGIEAYVTNSFKRKISKAVSLNDRKNS